MELLLNWILRGITLALGIGAGAWILGWFRSNWHSAQERWTVRIAAGMLVLAGVYAIAHTRLLAQRSQIEAGREEYAVFGDPRRTELRRGEVRGWMLDCTGDPANALAGYRVEETSPQATLHVSMKYGPNRERVIAGLRRISKPGLRVYVKRDEIPRVLGGLGVAILSTNDGLMTDRTARKKGVGGEVIAYVW